MEETRYVRKKFTTKKIRPLTDMEGLCSYGLFLLGLREYSEAQLREKMVKRCEDAALVQSALDKLKSKNYLSDQRKADSVLSQYGKKESGHKLKQRFILAGLDKELIEQTINSAQEDLTQEDKIEQCLEVLVKKHKVYNPEKKDKYLRFLISRGFSYSLANSALKEFETKSS